MKLMDLLNENNLNEATYSVTVDLMGPIKVQVKAKDEKEAKKIVASKLQRGMRDVKKVKKISEGVINEAINLPEGSHTVKTERFGDIRFTVEDVVTGPGMKQQLMIEVKHQKPGSTYLGHWVIEGDTKSSGGTGKVTFKKGKSSVKLP